MSTAAFVLGVVSLVIASGSLAWNVYRDLLLRPRTRVSAMISYVSHRDTQAGPFVSLTLVNLGPGRVILQSIVTKKRSLRMRLKGQPRFAVIINDYTNPYNPQMPTSVEPYETTTQLLPHVADSFLSHRVTKIGFIDTLYRYHWIPRHQMRLMQRGYDKDFGSSET